MMDEPRSGGAGKPTGERGELAAVTQTVDGEMWEKGETKERQRAGAAERPGVLVS